MKPDIRAEVHSNSAVVYGFDLEAVKKYACFLAEQGFVPVHEEYCLMQNWTTGECGHMRKVHFIKS